MKDFPQFFFQIDRNYDERTKAAKQMKLLGLLNDLKTVSQEPVNFTAGSFYTRVHHIFQFLFGVLEASVSAFQDSLCIPRYNIKGFAQETLQASRDDRWFLFWHLFERTDKRIFSKFLREIKELVKKSFDLHKKNPEE